MPVDIDRRIDAKAGKSLLQKSGKRIQSASKLDWAMSRNYQFVPYKEMSDYQKAMVRQVLEARRCIEEPEHRSICMSRVFVSCSG